MPKVDAKQTVFLVAIETFKHFDGLPDLYVSELVNSFKKHVLELRRTNGMADLSVLSITEQ